MLNQCFQLPIYSSGHKYIWMKLERTSQNVWTRQQKGDAKPLGAEP